MLAALLLAARLTLPLDSTVLLIRVLEVSDARVRGDAILITDASAGRARHVLIDAGEHGATIVARLTSLNVDTLAAVILSHPHADHYGGLGAVVSRFPVRAFLYGGTPRTALTYRALLRADVLKAGHHGSSNATTAELLDAVQPRAVIISANGRQHPFASVLALLAARGIPTYCTADNGTVTVRVPPHGTWTVTTEREGKCHARVVRN